MRQLRTNTWKQLYQTQGWVEEKELAVQSLGASTTQKEKEESGRLRVWAAEPNRLDKSWRRGHVARSEV